MLFSISDQTSVQASSQVSAANLTDQFSNNLSATQRWLEDAYNWFISSLPNFIAALLILLVGWWITRIICKIIRKAMEKSKADPTVCAFLLSLINVALKIIVIICAISTVGFDVTTLITTIGAAAVTVGLALKDSLANVASGTLIILNQRFKIGDYIEAEGLKGKVVKIDMMYTILCTYDNKEILIPNSRLTTNNVTNYFVMDERRIDLIVPIAYSEDISKARDVIMTLIRNDERVIQEKYNRVAVQTLNESSVDLSVWIWVKSDDYWKVMEDMQESIKNSLDANHIQIPFNQLDVHIIEAEKKALIEHQ
ncbi:MAG: mechanosensitive ion channel [Clostridia bacterium]|nr:mechanosensitive ion channel [Clostridia bacterium]